MGDTLKKGMLTVLIANLVNLGFSLLSSFILPKWLSIDSYSTLKSYQLYASYAGLLHFGFVDGVYLSYGGKKISEIGEKNLDSSLYTIRIFQLIVTIGTVVIGVVFNNTILIAFGISILPANMVAYFKNVYQAVGEFSLYSKVLNCTTISYFVLNMILVFLVKTDNPYFYISVFIIVDLFLWIILETYVKTKLKVKLHYLRFSVYELFYNIKSGILLTLGNFSSILLTGMDRWFIKALLTSTPFAHYSFAVSMENFINVAVTPITVTMYNFFCKENSIDKIKKIRNCVIIFSSFLISCAFPVKFIIEHFLDKYSGSVIVMFVLFGAQLFYIVIKSIYVNIYKAKKEQRKYFVRLVTVIAAGFVFNVLCYFVYKGKEAFAVGTLLSSVVWLFLCLHDHKHINMSNKEIFFMMLQLSLFLFCGITLNSVLGFFAYISVTILLSILFLREDFLYLLQNGMSFIGKK